MTFPKALSFFAATFVLGNAMAQTPIAPPTGQKTLAATLNVYAFPGAGQNPQQQSVDESQCYTWATQETGNDPFALDREAAEQQRQADLQRQQGQQAVAGSGVRGAVGGAAGGAIIGGIAGDAGKGAAIGAGVGAVANRARARSQAQQAKQQAQQNDAAAKAAAAKIGEFKKAFSACLEANKYTVKF